MKTVEKIREASGTYARTLGIHLFIAGPVGFAFLLGQLLTLSD